MLRRFFKFLLVITLLMPITVLADQTTFELGKDYELVPGSETAANTNPSSDNKIQVVEFFSYGCPWCFRLEPALEKWLANKPSNVNFERIPVVFNSGWPLLAKAYYTAVALNKEPQLTMLIFKALHEQNITLDNEQKISDFFVQHGINKGDFDSAFNFSPGIDAKMLQGQELMKQYSVVSVPTMVIAGKYKTNTALANGDMNRMMEIVNYLIQLASEKK